MRTDSNMGQFLQNYIGCSVTVESIILNRREPKDRKLDVRTKAKREGGDRPKILNYITLV